MDIKKKFYIKDLNCANCAAKIEKKINDLPYVKEAVVNFVSKEIIVKTDKEHENNIGSIVQDIVIEVEGNIDVCEITNDKQIEVEEESHRNDFIRFIIGAIIFLVAIVFEDNTFVSLPLFIIGYLLIGGDIVWRAITNIFKGNIFDENFLMTVATFGAFAIGEYPEAVAVMLFYQVGEAFQEMAVNKSRKSIKSLMSIRPDVANIKVGEEIKTVDIDDVNIGDIIIVKVGERIPLDGVVISGTSALDTKALTGESLPVNVDNGDQVLSGCINLSSVLTVKVTKKASESTVAKILELVQNASNKKANTEKFITKFARVYTPIVTISALLLALIPPIFFGQSFDEWLYRAFVFLVISCPCALVISIPLGFFSGIGTASKHGILIKGGNYLEALNNVNMAVFDKTGTLTEGVFSVSEINVVDGFDKDELLKITAHIESNSNHPIAKSIIDSYNNEIKHELVSDIKEIAGLGISGLYNNKFVLVGNVKLMNENNIEFDESEAIGSILYVAYDNKYIGNIVVNDVIKEDAKETINTLRNEYHFNKLVMLTGDKDNIGKHVGNTIGLDNVYTELLPNQKLEKVEELIKNKSENDKLLAVGDGINDTPILARVDIGIAMGGLGSDAAIEVADIVIMSDEPSKIVTAIKIAHVTRRIVWQNIIFALGVKLIVLILGAIGYATMWAAVFADVGVALLAVLNAMRILRFKE